ncbi:MAG: hypothetical protein IPP29_23565 [Bacteroidetes bacterium]|nr:hypothetical protein [Bacteroidota bacterium]
MEDNNVVQNYKFYFLILLFCTACGGCVQTEQSKEVLETNKIDSLVTAIEKLNKKQREQDSILHEKIKELDKMEN